VEPLHVAAEHIHPLQHAVLIAVESQDSEYDSTHHSTTTLNPPASRTLQRSDTIYATSDEIHTEARSQAASNECALAQAAALTTATVHNPRTIIANRYDPEPVSRQRTR
jgi:hypothetical protein